MAQGLCSGNGVIESSAPGQARRTTFLTVASMRGGNYADGVGLTPVDRRTFLRTSGLATAGLALSVCASDPSASTRPSTAHSANSKLTRTAALTTWGSDQEIATVKTLASACKAARGPR